LDGVHGLHREVKEVLAVKVRPNMEKYGTAVEALRK
jgi:hypothetical protein